jgi:hypothetical protein
MVNILNIHLAREPVPMSCTARDPSVPDSMRMLRRRREFGRRNEPSRCNRCRNFLSAWLAGVILWATAPQIFAAAPTFRDEMDGEKPALRLQADSSFQILSQRIDRNATLRHGGSEVVELQGPAGESAQLHFRLPAAPVINELRLVAEISSNRPGLQIAALVLLPRSRDSKTGLQRELLIRGGNLSHGHAGEHLVLDDIPKLLERQARVARLQTSDSVDVREAYVSQLVFLVPGGPGVSELSVDWIALEGVVQDRVVDPQVKLATADGDAEGPLLTIPNLPAEQPVPVSLPVQTQSRVNRIIEWQGEPLEFLSKLGFNAVWVSREPTPEELSEAGRLGIALVAPPPSWQELESSGISAKWNPVLAWDLGSFVANDDINQLAELNDLVQHHDTVGSRGTVMSCEQLSRDASRITDAIVLGREILGTDLTLRDYVTWLIQRQRIARPGTPIWATIENEFSLLRAQQVTVLRGQSEPVSLSASYDQLAALSTAAMSVKCRDFVFTSHSPLNADNEITRQRARSLELNNLRLRLLAPWLATGKVMGVDRSSEPGLSAMVFQAERSHLLVPVSWARNFRSQQTFHVPGSVTFIVPGVAETTDVYLLTLGGAKRLRPRRTTGGLEVSVDSMPLDGLIMLTSDPRAFSQVSQYLRSIAPRAARLERDCAAFRFNQLEAAIADSAENSDAMRTTLARAKLMLAACDRDLTSGFVDMAIQRTDQIDRLLSQAEYMLRNQGGAPPALFSPLEFNVTTIATERQLQGTLANITLATPLVVGGEFEDLQALLSAGWRHQQLTQPGIASAVRLSPDSPHEGTYCLELEVTNTDPDYPVAVVPTSPVWISTPPLAVKVGEFVEITGMVRVPEPLIGTVDGLQIIDSLGGPGMATRMTQTQDWQPVRIVRAVPADGQVIVSIALAGLGKAHVDNLAIRSLRRNNAVATESADSIRQ